MAWINRPQGRKPAQTAGITDRQRQQRMKVYNRRLWKKLRLSKLRETPLCEICRMEGRVRAGEDVHHIESFTRAANDAERDRLAFDPSNLLTVCDRCHQRLHHGDLRGKLTKKEIENAIKTENHGN